MLMLSSEEGINEKAVFARSFGDVYHCGDDSDLCPGRQQRKSGKEFLALEKNGVINMTGNVTLTSSAVIRGDLIIRLNGYSLSRDTSNSNSLGVLLLDISSGSVTIVGPGTITGGEYGRIRNIMPKGVVAVAGSASLTIKDGAVISGGKDWEQQHQSRL